jgi:glycosyltransferase involved in cell wall biosynthesis
VKFSVLLPTRNRLEYLRYAIESVRRQDYGDWEIIVSDNYSEDDIAGYVRSLADQRIRYFRTDRPVPVTENWNNALRHSDGDYVVMLGDDDGLLPGYFATLLQAFSTHPDADYVYVGAYFFAYRGAVPEAPEGFLRLDSNSLFTSGATYWLDDATARGIARSYLDFRMPVASNMQFSLVSRRMVQELSKDGPFFRSPFPDFYATPLLFLRSSRILICAKPLVAIGITPKSYGTFHFSNRSSEGVDFLGNMPPLAASSAVDAVMLPGTTYYDSWLLAADAVHEFCGRASDVKPAYGRYRLLQIIHVYKGRYFDRRTSPSELAQLRGRMTATERLTYGLILPVAFALMRCFPGRLRSATVGRLRRVIGQHPVPEADSEARQCGTLLDVFEYFDTARSTSRP